MFLLAANYGACLVLPMRSLAESKAVVINASQKTVNTAVSVIQFLPLSLGNHGLLLLPCIISHFVQVRLCKFPRVVCARTGADVTRIVVDYPVTTPTKLTLLHTPSLFTRSSWTHSSCRSGRPMKTPIPQ